MKFSQLCCFGTRWRPVSAPSHVLLWKDYKKPSWHFEVNSEFLKNVARLAADIKRPPVVLDLKLGLQHHLFCSLGSTFHFLRHVTLRLLNLLDEIFKTKRYISFRVFSKTFYFYDIRTQIGTLEMKFSVLSHQKIFPFHQRYQQGFFIQICSPPSSPLCNPWVVCGQTEMLKNPKHAPCQKLVALDSYSKYSRQPALSHDPTHAFKVPFDLIRSALVPSITLAYMVGFNFLDSIASIIHFISANSLSIGVVNADIPICVL